MALKLDFPATVSAFQISARSVIVNILPRLGFNNVR